MPPNSSAADTVPSDAAPSPDLCVTYEEAVITEGPGSRIGPYELQHLLGEGGFGRVFRARQEHPVQREVALKIIKLGMDTRRFIARFEAERQALALMDHPGIARVLDAGATQTGRPYFVMELVPGVPVTQFCDESAMSIRERLGVFIQICQAVQHAHLKGIVHRDIKPRNVLATRVDGRPFVKVIDFGIAKTVDRTPSAGLTMTGAHQVIGTPQYMSPEQAEGAIDIDTRSDVYSLGVLLFELLTGLLPFDAARLGSSATQIQRAIRRLDPPRPSTRLAGARSGAADAATFAGAPASGAGSDDVTLAPGERPTGAAGDDPRSDIDVLAARRGTDRRGLLRAVRGDLDWIVMMALERDRAGRYETASALAADVQRYLRHEPVVASPPSRRYRAAKLIRRHRAAFTTAALVAVALLAALGVSLRAMVEARSARAAMEVQRDRARKEADRAEATADFARTMLSGIEPRTARGADTTLLRAMLEQAAARVESQLQGQPEVEAAIRCTIGTAYDRIGEYAAAMKHLRAAEALQLKALGPDDRQTLKTRSAIAFVLLNQGEHVRAEAILRSLYAQYTRLFGEQDRGTVEVMRDLATVLGRLGRHAEAETLSREAVRTQIGKDDDDLTLSCMLNLGNALCFQSRYEEAEPLLRRVYDQRKRLSGPDHPSTFVAMDRLSAVLEYRGQSDEAVRMRRELVDGIRRVDGARHPETLKAMNNLAATLTAVGRPDQAVAMHRKILGIRREVLGPQHPETLYSIYNLGWTLWKAGQADEAGPLMHQSLAERERVLGPDHPDTISSAEGLAMLMNEQGQSDEAAALFGRVARAKRQRLSRDDPNLGLVYYNWAASLQNAGDDAAAEPIFRETVALAEALPGRDNCEYLPAAYNGLAKALSRRKDYPAAEAYFKKGLALRCRRFGDKHAETVRSQGDYAASLVEQRRFDEADALLALAREYCEDAGITASHRYAVVLGLTGECRTGQGRFEEAEQLLRDSRAVLAAHRDDASWRRLDRNRSLARLAELYEAWDAAEGGTRHAKESARWRRRVAAASQPSSQPE